MKVKLIIDIPEAKNKDKLRNLVRQLLVAAQSALIKFNVIDFELDA